MKSDLFREGHSLVIQQLNWITIKGKYIIAKKENGFNCMWIPWVLQCLW